MTFTKAELALALMTEFNLSRNEANAFISDFFEEIGSILESGEAVKLSGIGKFSLREKRSRPGRNPKTREPVPVSARRVVTFHASPSLKQKVTEIYKRTHKLGEAKESAPRLTPTVVGTTATAPSKSRSRSKSKAVSLETV